MDKARETALKALIEIETKKAYSNLVLKNLLHSDSLDTRDRAFISELVYGTVSRKLTIDWIISQFSKTKLKKISLRVLSILRLGVYQIMFLDRVPLFLYNIRPGIPMVWSFHCPEKWQEPG